MEKLLYDGFHKIKEIEAVINDKKVKREKLLLKSAVGGIVIDEKNRIGLVVQNRPTIGQMTREIPAGVLDKEGLTPKQILIEELEEECQIQMNEILSISDEPFQEYYMVTGSSDATMSIYEVRVKEQLNKTIDDVDVESVEWVDLDTLEQYVKDGSIVDGKTLISYYYLKSKQSAPSDSSKEEVGGMIKFDRGTPVNFEVFIENPRYVSVGSVVEFEGNNIEVDKIDVVVPFEQSVLVRGTGRIL